MIGFSPQNGPARNSRQVLLLMPLLLLLAGCAWRDPKTLPGQMVGEWRTDEPRYNGRFLRLEADRITFGLGGVAPDKAEHVERVRMVPRDNPTEYTVHLTSTEGTTDSIALQFTAERGGELRIKSQPKVVWRRKSEPARTLPSVAPQRETQVMEGWHGEHKTIYTIDCLRPKVCRSY
jgi:hypothetical protein